MNRLFIPWYTKPERLAEVSTALRANAGIFDDVVCLCETESDAEAARAVAPVRAENIGRRPTFADFFERMRAHPDDFNVVANADIEFDASLFLIASAPTGVAFAISRRRGWRNHSDPIHPGQDAWAFRGGPPESVCGQYPLGQPGCDWAMAHELREAYGKTLTNPATRVVLTHHHDVPTNNRAIPVVTPPWHIDPLPSTWP